MSYVVADHAPPTLAAALWPAEGRMPVVRAATLVIIGSLLLTLSAKVEVPFWPVPLTMQSLAVLVIGMAYGLRLGALAVLLYLAEGAVGLPVFAGTPERGMGLAYMVGPTGGYLLGFLAAAVVLGALAERGWDRSWLKTLVAMVLGHGLIFLPGVLWLAVLIGGEKARRLGLDPFIAATLLKTALGMALMPLCWRGIQHLKQ